MDSWSDLGNSTVTLNYLLTQVTIFINLLTKIISSPHTTKFFHLHTLESGLLSRPSFHSFSLPARIFWCNHTNPVSSLLWDQQLCYCRDFHDNTETIHTPGQAESNDVLYRKHVDCVLAWTSTFYIKVHLWPVGIFLKLHRVPQKLLWQIWQTPQKHSSKCSKRTSACSKFWLSIFEAITCQYLCCVLSFSTDSVNLKGLFFIFPCETKV